MLKLLNHLVCCCYQPINGTPRRKHRRTAIDNPLVLSSSSSADHGTVNGSAELSQIVDVKSSNVKFCKDECNAQWKTDFNVNFSAFFLFLYYFFFFLIFSKKLVFFFGVFVTVLENTKEDTNK